MKTTENIIESNTLIAQFMGLTVVTSAQVENYEVPNYPNGIVIEYATYDKDWNNLMPVVEKIVEVCDNNLNAHRYWNSEAETDIRIFRESKETTYNAVIEFIKWYNTNKEAAK